MTTVGETNDAKIRPRLEFLDGLRGLAALYVTLSHAYDEIKYRDHFDKMPPKLLLALKPLMYGRYAVSIFIVLSGYCLMLPVARSADGALRGGISEYLKRRARRILPPYYSALALTLLLIAVVPWLSRPMNEFWDLSLPAFRADILVSHLLLVQNLSLKWIYKIQGPLWSVATEWQIYFVFPILLLPIWRRFGLGTLVVTGFLIGLLPHLAFFHYGPYSYRDIELAAPWFIGLFTFGMAGAIIGFSKDALASRLRERVPWGLVFAIFFAMLIVLNGHSPGWWKLQWFGFVRDSLVGVVAATLIVYCARDAQHSGQSRIRRLLESRPSITLGVFSYSLYLTHQPLIALMHVPLQQMVHNPVMRTVLLYGLVVPVTVGCAYLFHLAFERRFMNLPAAEWARSSVHVIATGAHTVVERDKPQASGIERSDP